MAHFAEVDIPFDFDNYRAAQAEYEKLFAMHHPGRTFGVDIEFDAMDPEVQKAWFIYYHEYWLRGRRFGCRTPITSCRKKISSTWFI